MRPASETVAELIPSKELSLRSTLAAQTEHAMPITGIVFFIYVCSKLLYADLYMMQRYKKLSCLAIMLTIYLVILHQHYYIY